MTPPAPSPGGSIAQLAADFLTQLRGGLIITPATISSQAAVPALQRLISTPDAQLATLLPLFQRHCSKRRSLFATIFLPGTFRSAYLSRMAHTCSNPFAATQAQAVPPGTSSSDLIAAAPTPAERQGGARSLPSSNPVAASPAQGWLRCACAEAPSRASRPAPLAERSCYFIHFFGT